MTTSKTTPSVSTGTKPTKPDVYAYFTEAKNPYVVETGEWQLFELGCSSARQGSSFDNDASNYLVKANAAYKKAESFRDTLERAKIKD